MNVLHKSQYILIILDENSPICIHTSSLFQPLLNQSTSPLGFATSFDFHNAGTFVGTASSKSTSIWDYDWYHKYMKKEPQLLQLPNNSFPVLESDKTSQMNNSQQTHNVVEPFIVGSASSLTEKNTNIWCDDNSFIDFPVEETDPKTLENIANMSRCIEEEDLINVWRSFQEEDVTNVMQQPSCC
ncbi:unnamed protein product [Vicia faba]|uniref:Uncharacterized protein n=1 Tax=Vicia faba TaxID=3906 RepID=A0AAV1A5Y5_VICFA|nr:unnamed protein product [Vicia faba]